MQLLHSVKAFQAHILHKLKSCCYFALFHYEDIQKKLEKAMIIKNSSDHPVFHSLLTLKKAMKFYMDR